MLSLVRPAFFVALLVLLPALSHAADSLFVEVGGERKVFTSLTSLPHRTLAFPMHGDVPSDYSGVPLRLLLEQAGFPRAKLRGAILSQSILVEGKDGSAVTFGVAELDSGLVGHSMLLADGMQGKALTEEDAPYRLIVQGDHGGARGVRGVVLIKVSAAK